MQESKVSQICKNYSSLSSDFFEPHLPSEDSILAKLAEDTPSEAAGKVQLTTFDGRAGSATALLISRSGQLRGYPETSTKKSRTAHPYSQTVIS